ncbi:hypothetical protein E2C01_000938 [Portunus trituberculatus]|uniref:Uncharacterized protein n=1 Tax=Portunus trituberculatus TaxID=210409 RepID=A0A5B7CL94_PORTR|nr:hypothetical protein [Portunus trituberculatus]
MADLIISFAVPLHIELVSVTKVTFCLVSDYWGFDGRITQGVFNKEKVENPWVRE